MKLKWSSHKLGHLYSSSVMSRSEKTIKLPQQQEGKGVQSQENQGKPMKTKENRGKPKEFETRG